MKTMQEYKRNFDTPQVEPSHAPERRDVHMDFANCDFKRWHTDGIVATQFWNAFSLFFPLGEKFFVHSVRPYRLQIKDEELAKNVAAFMGQKVMHSREHYEYVAAMERQGYPVKSLNVRLFRSSLKDISEVRRLGTTAAMEHLTATISRVALTTTWAIRGDSNMCRLWFWHAIEELEHKAVVMSILDIAVPSRVKRYALRVFTAVQAASNFLPRLLCNHVALLQATSGQNTFLCWVKVCWFVGVYPGILRRVIPEFLQYLRPSFHPDDQDDRRLLSFWKQHSLLSGIFGNLQANLKPCSTTIANHSTFPRVIDAGESSTEAQS